jgi:hypothetical protein
MIFLQALSEGMKAPLYGAAAQIVDCPGRTDHLARFARKLHSCLILGLPCSAAKPEGARELSPSTKERAMGIERGPLSLG